MSLRPIPTGLLLLATLIGGSAQAQTADSPWYAGASLGVTQIRNVYRADDVQQPANDDQLRSASLLAGARLRLGRQRLQLDTRISQNDYQRNRDLRNLAYNGGLTMDWVLGARLGGQLSLGAQRSLAPFNPGNAPVTTEKNIESSERARLSARYGLAGLWSVDGSLSANRRDYSIALYDRYDYSQQGGDLGLRWQAMNDIGLRVSTRRTSGEYPRHRALAGGAFEADRFRRKDIDLTVDWTPGTENRLVLRVSDGSAKHTSASARDFKGSSGRLDWTWVPTSRIRLQTSLSRENGDDSRLVDLGFFGSFNSSNSRRYDSLQLQAAYAVSAKISVDLNVSELRRELTDSFGANSNTGRDRTRAAGAGVRWAFDRRGQFGCQWASDRRSGAAGFSLPYKASSVGCSLQYMIDG